MKKQLYLFFTAKRFFELEVTEADMKTAAAAGDKAGKKEGETADQVLYVEEQATGKRVWEPETEAA